MVCHPEFHSCLLLSFFKQMHYLYVKNMCVGVRFKMSDSRVVFSRLQKTRRNTGTNVSRPYLLPASFL